MVAESKTQITLSNTRSPARRTPTAAVYGFKMAPKTSGIFLRGKNKRNMRDADWCFLRLTEPEDELCFETSSLSSMILQTQRRAFETKHTRPHQCFHLTFLTFHNNEAPEQKMNVFFPPPENRTPVVNNAETIYLLPVLFFFSICILIHRFWFLVWLV